MQKLEAEAGAWRAEIGRWWMGGPGSAGDREVVVDGPKRAEETQTKPTGPHDHLLEKWRWILS